MSFDSEKEKRTVLFSPETWERVVATYKTDNCATRSEFVENADIFYLCYLNAEAAEPYLPGVLGGTLEGHLNLFANRIGSLLFKQAVELDMIMNIISADTDVDVETLEKLRGKCVRDVKSTNGQIGFKEALRFQKEI